MVQRTKDKELEIKVCRNCLALFINNRWQTGSRFSAHLEQMLRMQLFPDIGQGSLSISNIDEIIRSTRNKEKKVMADIIIKDESQQAKAAKHHHAALSLKYGQCTACSRLSSGYYEGILQLRNRKSRGFDAVLDDVLGQADSARGATIVKTVEQKDGIDVYLTSKKLLMAIGKRLYERYGGTLKKSRSLFSRSHETSKNVYRVSVMFRLPDYSKGDIVMIHKKPVLLSSIKKNTVVGRDLAANKRFSADAKHIERIIPSDNIVKTPVSKTRPRLEVLHPETFQSTPVENPARVKGGSAAVIEIDGRLYLIPA